MHNKEKRSEARGPAARPSLGVEKISRVQTAEPTGATGEWSALNTQCARTCSAKIPFGYYQTPDRTIANGATRGEKTRPQMEGDPNPQNPDPAGPITPENLPSGWRKQGTDRLTDSNGVDEGLG